MVNYPLQDTQGSSNVQKLENGNSTSGGMSLNALPPTHVPSTNHSTASTNRSSSSASTQILAKRKMFVESQIGRSSFHKLLEPSQPQRPGLAPYRIVLGNVKDKVKPFLLLII